MPRSLSVSFGFAAVSLVLGTPHARAAELCGRNVVSVPALHNELMTDVTTQGLGGNSQFVALADQRGQTVWTFTKAGHPAHPAVVCRRPVQRANQIDLQMQMMCGGTKPACDALVESFKGLNDRVQQELKG